MMNDFKDRLALLEGEHRTLIARPNEPIRITSYNVCYTKLLRAAARARMDRWLERFGLSEWRDKRVDSLSKGMSQKAQFIASVLHDPQIVFLDEPFSGLDPVSADELLGFIREFRDEGKLRNNFV